MESGEEEGEGKEGRREGGSDLPDQCLTASYAPGNERRKRRVVDDKLF